jgi:hypothetical protein
MTTNNDATDFIVTTTNGTRWGTTAASFAQVRREFFGKHVGLKIEKIERGRLFTSEEEEEMDRDKARQRAE